MSRTENELAAVDDLDETALVDVVRAATVINRMLRVREARLEATADAIVATAKALTGFEAGLVVVKSGKLVPQATTSPAPHQLDLLQQQVGDGPCIEAAREQTVVLVADTAAESRWGPFAERAAELGVASVLCVPLSSDDRLIGTTSLYAPTPDAFGERDRGVALLCATLAAAALSDAQRTEQLRDALSRRDLIGQAKGILMATAKVTADQAFAMLTRASQNRNQKLPLVAEYVVETGMLPPH